MADITAHGVAVQLIINTGLPGCFHWPPVAKGGRRGDIKRTDITLANWLHGKSMFQGTDLFNIVRMFEDCAISRAPDREVT